jgi:hypothetical protein
MSVAIGQLINQLTNEPELKVLNQDPLLPGGNDRENDTTVIPAAVELLVDLLSNKPEFKVSNQVVIVTMWK